MHQFEWPLWNKVWSEASASEPWLVMPDSSRASFQSIVEARGLSSIEQPISNNTTTAGILSGQESQTPASGSRETAEGSGSTREKV